ncbi:MAG: restriction endonuclease [Epsilonproteobacteria bacterium]|nr:MAG: restriction endonuclease [Campylobacterota bacterium]
MQINLANEKEKSIEVKIPLTTTSGKIRIKKRSSILDYGLPYASRSNPFLQNNYVEWQIGYDIHKTNKNFNQTTLETITFEAYNGKNKSLYELSEYLYYFSKWNIIKEKELILLKNYIISINDDNLLNEHKHCQIKRTHPNKKEINGIKFNALTIEYPQLVYQFGKFEIIAEVTIREKQRAVGTQPMLYFCFPITELKSSISLLGRCANIKEIAYFVFDKNNYFIILEMLKIFGMLSPSHKADTLAIINTVLRGYK